MTILYQELAGWFHLLSDPSEYADEAAAYAGAIKSAVPGARTLLELGSGGGNNASHLKRDFQCTLTDLSEPMLALSRTINPECEHQPGDMRTLRLDRSFDAVLVHDAVCYMITEDDLRCAIETAFVHTRPGGVAVFAPDCFRETFVAHTDCGGHDRGERGLRYLEWCWDPDPNDTTYLVDFAYLVREGTQVRALHDRHLEGMFPHATWIALLEQTGYRVSSASRPSGGGEEIDEILVAIRP